MGEARVLEELLTLLEGEPTSLEAVQTSRTLVLDLEREARSRIVEQMMVSRQSGSYREHLTLAYGRALSDLVDEWHACVVQQDTGDARGLVRALRCLVEHWLQAL
jgi:hypothetical protein